MTLNKLMTTAICLTGLIAMHTEARATGFAACVNEAPIRFAGTVVDAAVATPELSTLVTAVTVAGLADTLATAEGITVYAPTNAAFEKIPAMLLSELIDDTEALTTVLTYHVTGRMVDPRVRLTATRVSTLAGQSVFFHRQDGAQRINSAEVNCTPVRTDNGTVYFIDSVLMPQF